MKRIVITDRITRKRSVYYGSVEINDRNIRITDPFSSQTVLSNSHNISIHEREIFQWFGTLSVAVIFNLVLLGGILSALFGYDPLISLALLYCGLLGPYALVRLLL